MIDLEQGIWFVYDGDCPLCTQAATALRIKEKYGQLNLLNAREADDHELMTMINSKGLDLDQGMVIYHQGDFYHGETALQFMAQFGAIKGWFNWLYKVLFWSKSLVKLIYPWMRGSRNFLIRGKGISRIDNLNRKSQPVFASVFAEDWHQLPPVLKQHYQPTAYTNEETVFKGVMDIQCSGPIKWLSPILWLMKGIPPKTENNIPVRISFMSQPDELALQYDRKFEFKGKKPYQFKSTLHPQGKGKAIEVMRFGVTWKMKLLWDEDRIKISHQGYALKWFGHLIPIPLAWLFGTGYAEEVAVNDECFDMSVKITHPLWGVIYSYSGRFSYQNNQ